MSKEKIKKLSRQIQAAKEAYYNSSTPIMTDAAFDALFSELKRIDPTNPIVTGVGTPAAEEWKKAKHQIPMGSLDKVQTPEEMSSWISATAKNQSIFVTEKLDGFSIELIYLDGVFSQAISRGDGVTGEDITVNVRKMKGVPLKIKNFTGSLRGEIILKRSNHKKYFPEYANPRNAVGICKRLDGTGSEHLDVYLYQALSEDLTFRTEQEQFEWLQRQSAQIPNWQVIHQNYSANVKNIWQEYQDKIRDTLDYDIDGLVVRINDLETQQSLGDKDLRPLGAVAFKFGHESAVTELIKVIWQTGSTGRQTPVAVFKPVNLAGATIERATLHNYSNFIDLELFDGCEVLISRRNDVIPFVEENLDKGKRSQVLTYPKKCEHCGDVNAIVGKYLVCPNTDKCPAQVVGRIHSWITTLNILEFGDALIERLVETGKVTTVADLYRLSAEDLAGIERMGDRSAKKCLEKLWEGSEISIETLLGALNIPMIGISMVKMITGAGYDSLDKIRKLSQDQLENISGIGPAKAQSIYNGIKNNEKLIDELLSVGVKIKKKATGKLTGKKICITGSTNLKRADLEKMIQDNGGDVADSVGKNCTHLIIADPNSTSAKAKSARKLNIVLISEDTFLGML